MTVRKPTVIVAATPLTGHTQPMLSIARILVTSGHDVTVLGGSRFAEAAHSTGASFVPLSGAADYDDRLLAQHFPEREATEPGLPRVSWEIAHLFGAAIPDQHSALEHLLTDPDDTVVLHDMLFLGVWTVLLGATGPRPHRVIGIGIAPLMLPDTRTTPFGPPPTTPGQDIETAAAEMNAAIEAALRTGQQHLEQVLTGLGVTEPVPFLLRGMSTVPDEFAQLTVEEFEFPRHEMPTSIHLVGPLPLEPHDWDTPEWWPELEGRRVVGVTQGTVANRDLTEVVQPTLDGLADQDVLVVAALGRDVEGAHLRLPSNARAADFIPFDDLFRRADVLVTNGGYGATQQALTAGLPLVVAGMTEDKAMVAARISAFGVGVDLATQRPSPEDIATAVHRVLDEPAFAERARHLSDRLQAADAAAALLHLVDHP